MKIFLLLLLFSSPPQIQASWRICEGFFTPDSCDISIPKNRELGWERGVGNCPVLRDTKGKIRRSSTVRLSFLKSLHLAHTPTGCQVDHIITLSCGGCDVAANLQLICGAAKQEKESSEPICSGLPSGIEE